MLKLKEIQTENLRSMSFDAGVPLKRITLLVGRNSAGKSSFARVFPLLRQSLETLRKSPVLWYGHFVDFGTFDDVCNRKHPNEPIRFKFSLVSSLKASGLAQTNFRMSEFRRLRIADGTKIDIEICISKGDEGTYLSKTKLLIGEQSLEINANQFGQIISIHCGEVTWKSPDNEMAYSLEGKLIPEFLFIKARTKTEFESIENGFTELIRSHFAPLLHGNTRETTIVAIARLLPIGSYSRFIEVLLNTLSRRKLTHYIQSDKKTEKKLHQLADAILIYKAPDILKEIEGSLIDYFGGVRYLAPLRATAQRYYRAQELAVDEIDPQGANVASVLSSMPPWQLNDMNEWMMSHLDFSVHPKTTGGHSSLYISFKEDETKTNLADMGFGFSQVLPIAIQIWLSGHEISASGRRLLKTKTKPTTCLVMEQPELHLHPAFQARLADLFVAASDFGPAPGITTVIETHSSTLINRFGELIYQGVINRDEIQILLFEGSTKAESQNVRIVTFDEDGYLNDWPAGFFEPDSPPPKNKKNIHQHSAGTDGEPERRS